MFLQFRNNDSAKLMVCLFVPVGIGVEDTCGIQDVGMTAFSTWFCQLYSHPAEVRNGQP